MITAVWLMTQFRQTNRMRAYLYFGLTVNFIVETFVSSILVKTKPLHYIDVCFTFTRWIIIIALIIILLYSFYSFKDEYEENLIRLEAAVKSLEEISGIRRGSLTPYSKRNSFSSRRSSSITSLSS